ncbi:hypothetical protein BKA61DRAFT_574276 [Leptodontidium sp. MPI-SDFR-AT-0119]|nr:hypothetical protein BKA61DRAFT_574276 [Leptodontidium sp. MPI-SDFR-AT-0119]
MVVDYYNNNTRDNKANNGKCIVVRGVNISLEDKPIASTKAIVCRGTNVLSRKMKLLYRIRREGELLKLVKERGVKGIAKWFHHEHITIDDNPDTIAHLQRGMKFGAPRKLSSKASWVNSNAESSRPYSRTRSLVRSRSSATRLTGLGISTNSTPLSSSAQKRQREEDSVDGSPNRSKSRDNWPGVKNLKAVVKGDSKGMLIDLDLVKELDSLPSGASHRIGTMLFMAIEVLQGKGHTYRHDLESFFYVLVWMCIRYGEDVTELSPPPPLMKRRRPLHSPTRNSPSQEPKNKFNFYKQLCREEGSDLVVGDSVR